MSISKRTIRRLEDKLREADRKREIKKIFYDKALLDAMDMKYNNKDGYLKFGYTDENGNEILLPDEE